MAKGHRRSSGGYLPRRVNTREIRQRFLIVCEGKRTEKLYFKSFSTPTVFVRAEHGDRDPVRLVEWTVAYRDRAAADGDLFDQVWCVFDRDQVTPERFLEALQRAKRVKIQPAYSSPKFELWLLLHFEACGGWAPPHEYDERLSRHLGRDYDKVDSRQIAPLVERAGPAIDRAARLLATYDPHDPANDDPCTTVHLLVKELLHFSRP